MSSSHSLEVSPRRDRGSSDESADAAFAKRGCCFWVPFLGSSDDDVDRPPAVAAPAGTNWWERVGDTPDDPWWARGWHRVREWSELVAGPRWKTFIRRFNKNRFSRNPQFRYDPLSYALNFDEGPGQNGHPLFEEDVLRRDFSSRYASIPASCKSSMDLGNHSGPLFT
ncbi:uncharacterized protein LOC115757480 [Rhodamnia argentea]|uniref:Uncharacterized protein LOC115757480 n=1 Tax=Rhodamnia argentea TaxID=178133 RepID=A0A8B8R269_9MYRT|nr:uncharacterized protein LOC115757480 [Rhodamnia argentea]